MLELKNKQFGLNTQIIRELSSLEPPPKVWNPKSKSKYEKLILWSIIGFLIFPLRLNNFDIFRSRFEIYVKTSLVASSECLEEGV